MGWPTHSARRWRSTPGKEPPPLILRVEYAEQRNTYGILSMFSLFGEYMNLAYVLVYVVYRAN